MRIALQQKCLTSIAFARLWGLSAERQSGCRLLFDSQFPEAAVEKI
jgi:hypothetical protein